MGMSQWGNEDLRMLILRERYKRKLGLFPHILKSSNEPIQVFWRWGWCTGRDHRTG